MAARALKRLVHPVRRDALDFGNDEAGVEAERRGFDARDGATRFFVGFGLMQDFGEAAHAGSLRQRTLNADFVCLVVDGFGAVSVPPGRTT